MATSSQSRSAQVCPGLAWLGLSADDGPAGLCVPFTMSPGYPGQFSEMPGKLTFKVSTFLDVDILKEKHINSCL